MWKCEKHQNEAIQISANMQESVAKIMSSLDPAIVIACVTETSISKQNYTATFMYCIEQNSIYHFTA
jgi:hypothetical protein